MPLKQLSGIVFRRESIFYILRVSFSYLQAHAPFSNSAGAGTNFRILQAPTLVFCGRTRLSHFHYVGVVTSTPTYGATSAEVGALAGAICKDTADWRDRTQQWLRQSYPDRSETTDRAVNLIGTSGGGTITQSGSGLLKFTTSMTAATTGAGSKTRTRAARRSRSRTS